jgi:hypothetical protein
LWVIGGRREKKKNREEEIRGEGGGARGIGNILQYCAEQNRTEQNRTVSHSDLGNRYKSEARTKQKHCNQN